MARVRGVGGGFLEGGEESSGCSHGVRLGGYHGGRSEASWAEARQAIAELPMKKFRTTLFTAHLMGGCGMSESAARGVVDSRGRHHQVANLTVLDGSVFPTSIGANPQLSIYALTAQNATALAKELGGR